MNTVDYTNDPADPRFISPEYEYMEEKRDLPQALWRGNDYVKSQGEKYLPKHVGETEQYYQLRLKRSVLYNVFGNFIDKVSIVPFRNGISYSQDTPSNIIEWCNDIDLLKTNIETWALNFYKDANINGISYFLVENPLISPNRTLFDDLVDRDIRPYFVHIKASDLYGWQYSIVNGKLELDQIRFKRWVVKQTGIYGTEKVKEYVVYTRDFIQVFEAFHNKKGDEEVALINQIPNTLGFIPLVTLNLNQIQFMVAQPMFGNLATLNLRHYQSYSDQINIVHHSRIPILFGKGLMSGDPNEKKEDFILSPGLTVFGGDNTDLKYVEHTGSAIKTGKDDITDLEEKMSIISGEFYNQRGVASITATSHILNKIESGVTPGANIRMLESCINQGFQIMRFYDATIPAFEGGVNLNTEDTVVPETVNFQYVTSMFTQGIISRETYLKEAKRRNILDDDTVLNTDVTILPEGTINT